MTIFTSLVLDQIQKMLEKMGWRTGQGLGRNQQGMSTPLVMQKTDLRTGVIGNGAHWQASCIPVRLPFIAPLFDSVSGELIAEAQPQTRQRQVPAAPSPILLLCNVVGRGEVDELLDEDIGQECSKYGQVLRWILRKAWHRGFISLH